MANSTASSHHSRSAARTTPTRAGTMVPTTSVDQYSATMAQWFGVSPANITSIFPYVSNFPTANLGFLNMS